MSTVRAVALDEAEADHAAWHRACLAAVWRDRHQAELQLLTPRKA
jgi:hypothetical protein